MLFRVWWKRKPVKVVNKGERWGGAREGMWRAEMGLGVGVAEPGGGVSR